MSSGLASNCFSRISQSQVQQRRFLREAFAQRHANPRSHKGHFEFLGVDLPILIQDKVRKPG